MNQTQIDTQQVDLRKIREGGLGSDWLIWLLAIICVWSGLGTYGILNNNEGLYVNIPFDMLYSGDWWHWIIPHLNGLPYMEKPPLMYWLTAIAMLIFGQAEWVVRLIPTLSGLSCVGLIMYFGRRAHHPHVGRLAALMFISGLGVICLTRTLLFDILLTAFLTAALVFGYFYLIESQKRDLRIAYISLALGVLTKGLVAVILFGLVIAAWLILIYGWASWRQLGQWFEPSAIGLFFLLPLPWIATASWVEPIFPWFFFINEHVWRFLGERLPHDYYSGPWWYYLPRIVLYLFPWSFLLPLTLFDFFQNRSERLSVEVGGIRVPGRGVRINKDSERPQTLNKGHPVGIERNRLLRMKSQESTHLKRMLTLGWLIPLVFFSASSNKANYYVVVVMPFAALSLALSLEQRDFLTGKKNLLLGISIALLAVMVAVKLQFFSNPFLSEAVASDVSILSFSLRNFVLIILWSLAGLALLAALAAWRIARLGLVAYVVLPLFLLATLLVKLNADEEAISARSLAHFIQQVLPKHQVYLYRHFEENSSLSFYLKKNLKVIDSTSNDLYWGNKLRPNNTIMMSGKQFAEISEPTAVLVPSEYVNEFKQQPWAAKFIHSKVYSRATLFY